MKGVRDHKAAIVERLKNDESFRKAYLNEALKLDPIGMADAHLLLAALYNAKDMKDKAAAEYEMFLKKRPDSPDKKRLKDYIAANKKP